MQANTDGVIRDSETYTVDALAGMLGAARSTVLAFQRDNKIPVHVIGRSTLGRGGGKMTPREEGAEAAAYGLAEWECPYDLPPDSEEWRAGWRGEPAVPTNPSGLMIVDTLNVLVRAYHASFATEHNGTTTFFQAVARLINKVNPLYIVFADDSEPTQRREVYPDYKAARKKRADAEFLPEQIAQTRVAIDTIGWARVRVPGWEADDIAATLVERSKSDVTLVSTDKDWSQLVGPRVRQFDPFGMNAETTADTVRERWRVGPEGLCDLFAFAGDPADGIPGVRGIGPKTAAMLLNQHGTFEGVILAAKTLKIPGKLGASIMQEEDLARKSRDLATLNRGLPICSAFRRAREPMPGWAQSLRDADLQFVPPLLRFVLEGATT